LSVDPQLLARVRFLRLVARRRTDALLVGDHRSVRVGQAIEFADYQRYTAGMDPRRIDWSVWGRTDRYVVRRYETETELPCVAVLDLSGDMATGVTSADGLPDLRQSKAGRAISLVATWLYWCFLQREPVGLVVQGGEGITHRAFPPRSGERHLQRMFRALASVRPGGEGKLHESLVDVGRSVRRRSLVAVFTDGMEEPSEWLPALKAFVRRGTDLRFMHLHSGAELELPGDVPQLFYSPEGGEALAVDPSGIRGAFDEVLRSYRDEVRTGVLRLGGQYLWVNLDDDVTPAFRRLVRRASDGRAS